MIRCAIVIVIWILASLFLEHSVYADIHTYSWTQIIASNHSVSKTHRTIWHVMPEFNVFSLTHNIKNKKKLNWRNRTKKLPSKKRSLNARRIGEIRAAGYIQFPTGLENMVIFSRISDFFDIFDIYTQWTIKNVTFYFWL